MEVDEARARIWVVDGDRIDLERCPLRMTVTTGQPLSDDALIHPYLGLPAAIASRWLGRQVLHGGAFMIGHTAWAVTADKGGGKSTTLARMLEQGLAVLSDDLLMIEEDTVFAGPRSIDLRDEAAGRYGGEELGFLGSRTRWRLRPPPTAASARLGGFVTLAWGDEVSLEPLDARERLAHIAEHSFMGPAFSDQLATLQLAALPAWRLRRPQRLEAVGPALEALLSTLA